MIFPFLNGILPFNKIPITWCLFFLNFSVLIYSQSFIQSTNVELTGQLRDEYFIKNQGIIFAKFIQEHPKSYKKMTRKLSEMVLLGEMEKATILGNLALRDHQFMEAGPNYSYNGDQVAIQNWKRQLASVVQIQQSHPSYIFGLSYVQKQLTQWISYQFTHSGFMHFFGNMLFLLIFGGILEGILGPLAFLTLYLASGMVAAGVFLLMNEISSVPLIGASGAISGLMALFCVLHWRRPVRYIYTLFIPKKEYLGFVYLPAWICFFIWLLTDLGGYLSSVAEFGGVAYSAHLGGSLAGVIAGLLISTIRRYRPLQGQSLGVLYSQ